MRPGVLGSEAPFDEFVEQEFLGAGDGGGGGGMGFERGEGFANGLEAFYHFRITVGAAGNIEGVAESGGGAREKRQGDGQELSKQGTGPAFRQVPFAEFVQQGEKNGEGGKDRRPSRNEVPAMMFAQGRRGFTCEVLPLMLDPARAIGEFFGFKRLPGER